jgi:hypothetical protein
MSISLLRRALSTSCIYSGTNRGLVKCSDSFCSQFASIVCRARRRSCNRSEPIFSFSCGIRINTTNPSTYTTIQILLHIRSQHQFLTIPHQALYKNELIIIRLPIASSPESPLLHLYKQPNPQGTTSSCCPSSRKRLDPYGHGDIRPISQASRTIV